MREILYLEVPTPDTAGVCRWLQADWSAPSSQGLEKTAAPQGIRLSRLEDLASELSVFVWSLQRTTYLKVFRWGEQTFPGEKRIAQALKTAVNQAFPPHYPAPPQIDLSGQNQNQTIFQALAPHYPQTAEFFQRFPEGERDLQRVYWWERRWREGVENPQTPTRVVKTEPYPSSGSTDYDLIYIGGALGVIHAAVMARLGYRVLLIERLPFGRMNREWNISRDEFQRLIDLGLFTPAEFEDLIAREYRDGFNKFFDANNPPRLKAKVLHTPRVLNIALDSARLLELCGEKLRASGGEIWEEREFLQAVVHPNQVRVEVRDLNSGEMLTAGGRLLVDAMGTASPIAWQFNGARAFSSVCPTVGAVIEGLDPQVWNPEYGDVLNSHGDISRGRQLIWELFPGRGDELTVYLFHYHQVHPRNPGSLLEMYEDFFTILPEYRRCELERLTWKKPTFGYIPGHFSVSAQDRRVAYDRVLAIGDAASLQSPLVFTGFGSLVRNLGRLTELLDTALRRDLLQGEDLNAIRAYQSNIAVTWLFSKGMMVPTGQTLPPQRINAMLNTFFGLLADSPPEVADTFIKDRTTWALFSRLALKAARLNPRLLLWIWQMAGTKDLIAWLGIYFEFSREALIQTLFRGWFPRWLQGARPWLEARSPRLWLQLLSWRYRLLAPSPGK